MKYYETWFLKVMQAGEEKYLPIVQCGYSANSKSYDLFNRGYGRQFLFTKKELEVMASDRNFGWNAEKSNGVDFSPSEFKKWFLSGLKKSLTLNDYAENGLVFNFNLVVDGTKTKTVICEDSVLVDLLESISKNDSCRLSCESPSSNLPEMSFKFHVEMRDGKVAKRPSGRAPRDFYAIKVDDEGYYSGINGRHFKIIDSVCEEVCKYPSMTAALNAIEKLNDRINGYQFSVEFVEQAKMRR